MNTFNKKSLYTAIAGLSALGVTGIAEAVHVNPDGLGQVLIYPYYTARQTPSDATFPNAQYNTLLSVVNSTASAKAVKVRFLESLNSREVLDFNLYLSHNDVWTAGIVPTSDGAGVVTYDKSCTTPPLTAGTVYPFVASQFSGSNADGADSSLDRTREGYIEIIEMGDIVAGSDTETGVTHVAGVPPCTALSDAVASTEHDRRLGRPVRRPDDHQRERDGRNRRRSGRAGSVQRGRLAVDDPVGGRPDARGRFSRRSPKRTRAARLSPPPGRPASTRSAPR